MNALVEYTETMEPVRGVESVRYYVEKKAKELADQCFPDNKEKNEDFVNAYMLGMFDTLELIYY